MSTSILEVRGIGPASANMLAEGGITTAEELAVQKVGQVTSIKGFSAIRAKQAIDAAKELLKAKQISPAPEPKPEKKSPSKKKAKEKSKEKKKAKSKAKSSKKDDKTDKKTKKNKKSGKNQKSKKAEKKSKKK